MGTKLRRWTGILLSAILILNIGIEGQAAQTKNAKKDAIRKEPKKEKELTPEEQREKELKESYDKKIETNEIPDWPQGPKIYGEAAVVMDMKSGAVLYGKGADERHYPASITKILTALVALENSAPTDKVVFSEESVHCLEKGYSHIGMKAGEEITMNDALHALMLASANEVAYAIAETVGGTYGNFLHMLNEKARELGCTQTHFINANGMFDENHYTSAADMALISRAAFQNEELLEIVQTKQYTIPNTNLEKESRTFQQKHKMMIPGKFFDDRCIGGKTGYTDEASNTLVTVMQQGDREIVAVVLKARKDIYPDTKKICDYAFKNFKEINIAENETSGKFSSIEPEAYVIVPQNVEFKDLQKNVENNEMIEYSYHGQTVGSAAAKIKKDIKFAEKKAEVRKKSPEDKIKLILKIAVVCVVILIVILIICRILIKRHIRNLKRKKRRKAMQQKRREQNRERR